MSKSWEEKGGAAFPVVETRGEFDAEAGMTLRDWFAGQALAAIATTEWHGYSIHITPNTIAKAAYDYADAMLKERAK